MRVVLMHKFYRDNIGGGETWLFETERLLREAGHEVAVLSTQHPDNRESEYSDYFVPVHNYAGGGPYQRVRALGTAMYSLATKRAAARLIEDFKPDIAHMMGIFSHMSTSVIDACAGAGVPVVLNCNDYKHICPNYKLYHHGRLCEDCRGGRFYHTVLNRCCHDSLAYSGASMLEAYAGEIPRPFRERVSIFLVPCEFMAQETAEFWGADSFRWRILRNPFTTPPANTVEHGEYALFFGRMVEEKGVDQLLRAAALMPEIPVRIVGTGPCEPSLRAQASEANLHNVEFLGPVWGAEMDRVLSGARLVVVPSRWHENFPYVILRAFAAGKPVVGSDRGGIPEMLGDGARGLLYPAEEPAALAAAVRRIWNDETLWEQMSGAARDYIAAEFSEESFMRSLMAAYHDAIGSYSVADRTV